MTYKMAWHICIVIVILVLTSCGSNRTDTELTNKIEVAEKDSQHSDTTPPYYRNNTSITEPIVNTAQMNIHNNSDSPDYKSGYSAGRNMGYIAGQYRSEYNPYLPVGPYARTHSLEYRSGYAAGYAVGYEEGQQATHQGIYSEEATYEYVEE